MRKLQERQPVMQLDRRRAEAKGGPPAGADLDPVVSGDCAPSLADAPPL